MKGIILSAGKGSRLLPLTQEMPKCLVAVDGRAILDHQLAALAASGVREAIVVGGYRFAQIADHLERTPPPLDVALIFNPFWAVASSIGSVWAARDHLGEPFCLMNGDTVFDPSVIVDAVGRTAAGIGLLVEPLHAPLHDDMRVAVATGRVRAVAKDLPEAQTTHRSLGVVLSRDTDDCYRSALDAVIAAPDGIGAYHHAVVAHLARTDGVSAIVNDIGAWQEIDRPEDIAGWTREHRNPAR